jgi:hypothetical protein
MAARRRSTFRALKKHIVTERDKLRRKFHASGVTRVRKKLLTDFHKLAKANKMLGLPVIDNFEEGDGGRLASARRPAKTVRKRAGKKR